jgi:ATP/maltotriose-dependent transcriptional regulator MalT
MKIKPNPKPIWNPCEDHVLCTNCSKRPLCVCLCPEAQAYTNQDQTYPHPGDNTNDFHFTEIEKKILNALLDGKTRAEIRETLECSALTLRQHINNLRAKR